MREIKLGAQRAGRSTDPQDDTMGNAVPMQRDGIPKSTRSARIIDSSNRTRPAPITQTLAVAKAARAKLRDVSKILRTAEKERKSLTREYENLAKREAVLRAQVASNKLTGRKANLAEARLAKIRQDKKSNSVARGNRTRIITKNADLAKDIEAEVDEAEWQATQIRIRRREVQEQRKSRGKNSSETESRTQRRTSSFDAVETAGAIELIDGVTQYPERIIVNRPTTYARAAGIVFDAVYNSGAAHKSRPTFPRKQAALRNIERVLQSADEKRLTVKHKGVEVTAAAAVENGMDPQTMWREISHAFNGPTEWFPYKGIVR
jgi:hypothetical protein